MKILLGQYFFFSYSNPFFQYTNVGYMLIKSKGTFTVTGSTYSPFHQGLKENMDVNGVSVFPQGMITLIFCPGSVTLDRFLTFLCMQLTVTVIIVKGKL